VRAETELSDLTREQEKFEREIEQVRARKARDEERMASGAITNPKQLQDMEHEVATLTRRQSDLEDGELEVMEKVEGVQAELDELVGRREQHLADRAAAEQPARRPLHADIDAEIARSTAERTEMARRSPADLLRSTRDPRREGGRRAAGRSSGAGCGGCRLDLMNNEKADRPRGRPSTTCCARGVRPDHGAHTPSPALAACASSSRPTAGSRGNPGPAGYGRRRSRRRDRRGAGRARRRASAPATNNVAEYAA
jgi:predicted  nucleic acid-binding Zn-ribbon protein